MSIDPTPLDTTITVSPASIGAGGTVTVSWSGISNPSSMDWIGLYAVGAGDNAFLRWMYVSCTMGASSAQASGSCPFVLPGSVGAGNYEFRLFANNGYSRLATSNQLAVTP